MEAEGEEAVVANTLCPGCGRRFECGMQAGRDTCWCAALPPLATPPRPGTGCYCPQCLAQRLQQTAASAPGQ